MARVREFRKHVEDEFARLVLAAEAKCRDRDLLQAQLMPLVDETLAMDREIELLARLLGLSDVGKARDEIIAKANGAAS